MYQAQGPTKFPPGASLSLGLTEPESQCMDRGSWSEPGRLEVVGGDDGPDNFGYALRSVVDNKGSHIFQWSEKSGGMMYRYFQPNWQVSLRNLLDISAMESLKLGDWVAQECTEEVVQVRTCKFVRCRSKEKSGSRGLSPSYGPQYLQASGTEILLDPK
ncbi:hypothetical protein BDP27DRAFT_1367817 [Rhodocollybia butyracea]|uniref:Uncharacterized protein n=1 Tax=Rhodocollybia butyracea TaxID=206335 RepID=A0A9P5PJF9_9AGAR|nr:hypothetical protein BDP27DRAFT_1367817 [Rhodocollybia butyracea]